MNQVAALADAGNKGAAVELAKKALADDPNDAQLRAFVELNAARPAARISEKTVAERAKELLAGLRGEAGGAGDAPQAGAAIMASPIPWMPAAGIGTAGMDRKTPGGLLHTAAMKFEMKDFREAEYLLTRRLKENPSDVQALRLRSLARRQMGRFDESSDDARGALTLTPWDSRSRRILIDDLVDLGRSGEAMREADLALKADPRDAQVLAARADVWASLGRREKQLADLKDAAELDKQFDALYQQARQAAAAPTAPQSRRPRAGVVWLGAIGTALLFFSFVVFRRRGYSSVRLAMRQEDSDLLTRGAVPDAVPKGFRVVKTLGQGGMGVVYEAVDLALERTVALKKLRAEVADNPRERARFLKEARTVAALKHPNIVEIHAIHEDAEGLFLVFERVPGETLHERLENGPLPVSEAVAILGQVAKALDHAHSQGVVHKDLKPANVMVADGVAKVMDFGIARRVQETLSTLSQIEVAGTPAYMAPEQENGGEVGPSCDVYALGICAYELLTGRLPFFAGGAMMKARKLFRPASELRPDLGSGVDVALARALEPEPSSRWGSASAFIEALARS